MVSGNQNYRGIKATRQPQINGIKFLICIYNGIKNKLECKIFVEDFSIPHTLSSQYRDEGVVGVITSVVTVT